MRLLPCPHCGPRAVSEFGYAGERSSRPDPRTATSDEWRCYLHLRANPAGWTRELWLHRAGCGCYLELERHTVTGEVR